MFLCHFPIIHSTAWSANTEHILWASIVPGQWNYSGQQSRPCPCGAWDLVGETPWTKLPEIIISRDIFGKENMWEDFKEYVRKYDLISSEYYVHVAAVELNQLQ